MAVVVVAIEVRRSRTGTATGLLVFELGTPATQC